MKTAMVVWMRDSRLKKISRGILLGGIRKGSLLTLKLLSSVMGSQKRRTFSFRTRMIKPSHNR